MWTVKTDQTGQMSNMKKRKFYFFLLLLSYSDFISLSAIFHIAAVSGCDRELNAHFKSAASLTYHTSDT